MNDEIIKWNNVHKAFGANQILRGLNLSVRRGETLTIIGGSGTGKSVMLKLLLGLLNVDSGHIYFEGADVTEMSDEELVEVRKQIGMLFQGGALFDSLTVAENIVYPLREHFHHPAKELRGIVDHKLTLVGLKGIEEMKPSDLSGGMKKRVALARAIATDPKVILYDEPTTGLDPANTMRINRLIRDLQKKLEVTSIVVTHDMNSAFFISDRIAMLYNQAIEYVGFPEEAKRSNNEVVQNFIRGHIGEEDKLEASCSLDKD